MAGEKAPVSFESATAKLDILLGLRAVSRTDLLTTVDDVERSGAELVNADPRKLGEVAQWMVHAVDGVGQLSRANIVKPPIDSGVMDDLTTKKTVYSQFIKTNQAEAEAPAQEPSRPQRTSDAKS